MIDVFPFFKLAANSVSLAKPNFKCLFIGFIQRQTYSKIVSSSCGMTFEDLDNNLKKRIFNTVLWEQDSRKSFVKRKKLERETVTAKITQNVLHGVQTSKPIALKFLDENFDVDQSQSELLEVQEEILPNYPFAENVQSGKEVGTEAKYSRPNRRQDSRRQLLYTLEDRKRRMRTWMSDYDLYDENSEISLEESNIVHYGTSAPEEPISKVPCGGCGAFLHCRDHSIPGYLPKELFSKRSVVELRSLICQRCHFLKEFNVALDVSVTPDEYPKIISCIQNKRALVVLMVDLLDFPCSIWPGIMDIIGTKRPVIIVGNKVDLIPGDHLGYMKHLKETLLLYVEKMGISKANVKHVALVSAETGFGVEDLITQLHGLWEIKGDVFLLGCTNVGKSTLFNKLLQSDFCKTKAALLVQRATTSVWPGTTLNLLKFPILRPEGWKLALRRKRLASEARTRQLEKKLRREQITGNRMYHLPPLLQYVGKTFVTSDVEAQKDMYTLQRVQPEQIGIDEEDPDFAKGRWCYDTPGVLHPDQILNILTTEELMKVIPKTPIVPRFFVIKPGRSLFLAGLGRIDLINSTKQKSARVAVFSSNYLPITIVQTHEAEEVYNRLLGSELLAVPCGGPQRLAEWPGLQAKDDIISVQGIGWRKCCADFVLSSAGWVAVSGEDDAEMCFQIWTPLARGIHLRQPALLPYAINFRGKRIDHTPNYQTGRADGKTLTSLDLEVM